MKIEKRKIDELIPAIYNPRKDLTIDDAEYKKIKRSIETFGYVDPIIVNERTGVIIGGHQRLKVLKDLGYEEIEVSVVNLDEKQEKALNVALNKISGEWDFELLKDLLEELDDGSFDVELTGFDMNEIENLMTQYFDEENNEENNSEENTSPVELNDNTVIVIEADSEEQLEEIFTELVEEGYNCRLLTL